MKFTLKKKIAAVGLAAGVSLGVGGAAFAYFTSTGSGTGAATVGNAAAWTPVSATLLNGGVMYPGVSSSDETFTVSITNSGHGYQNLNKFVISVAKADGTTWTGPVTAFPLENGCSASDFALGGQAAAGSYTVSPNADVAPGTAYTTTVTVHMLDTGVPQDNCQGLANVPLYISAS